MLTITLIILSLLLLLLVSFCVMHLERLAGLIKSHFLGGQTATVHL